MSQVNFQDIIQNFTQQRDAANQANESRYRVLLRSLKNLGQRSNGTYDEILGKLSTSGDAAKSRVRQDSLRLAGQSEQDLVSRGLGNTTIRSSVQRGVMDDTNRALGEIDQRVDAQKAGVLQNKIGTDLNISGQRTGVIERRNDVGPDLGQFAGLLQMAAAAGDPNQKINANVGRGLPPGPIFPGGVGGGGSGGSGGGSGGFGFASGGSGGIGDVTTVTNNSPAANKNTVLGGIGNAGDLLSRRRKKKANEPQVSRGDAYNPWVFS